MIAWDQIGGLEILGTCWSYRQPHAGAIAVNPAPSPPPLCWAGTWSSGTGAAVAPFARQGSGANLFCFTQNHVQVSIWRWCTEAKRSARESKLGFQKVKWRAAGRKSASSTHWPSPGSAPGPRIPVCAQPLAWEAGSELWALETRVQDGGCGRRGCSSLVETRFWIQMTCGCELTGAWLGAPASVTER